MIDKLLEKFEDVFKPASKKEMKKKIQGMTAEDLVSSISDIVTRMTEKELINLYNRSSFISLSELLTAEIFEWINDANITKSAPGLKDLRELYGAVLDVKRKGKR